MSLQIENNMDKAYDPKSTESKIYQMWEAGGYFTPEIDPKKTPFSIILPLPNANDPMHMGHALFTVQDIMIRYHRMLGDPTLWLPGGDHAGIETQFVFEKKLAKEGKSRFDFDRDTLYHMIAEFVDQNRNVNRDQMKQLGFSLDWTRYHYSMEPQIVEKVLATFMKMFNDDLVYRAERLVNYCTKCGTAFSDLEVKYVQRPDPLYYIKYGPFFLATTRPETKFGDTAVAFHPGDIRYEKYLGQELTIEGVNGPFTVKAVADDEIDPEFGTGIEKVTPAHDFLDYEIAKRHNLPIKKVIDINGRLTTLAGSFAGMKVKAAREAVVAAMQEKGLIDHIDTNYIHNVATCYRCGTTIEPMLMPQWYVKTKPLAKPAIDAVKSGKTKIVPLERFKKLYFDWMENIEDWNISRQIVWGPRMPVWYKVDGHENEIWVSFITKNKELKQGLISEHISAGFTLAEIEGGIQKLSVPIEIQGNDAIVVGNTKPKAGNWIQETDTFDTWFLSGQWPVNTLKASKNQSIKESTIDHQLSDFEYFYPTSVLDTLWDILFFWVARMMMFGLYLTGDVPFKVVHLHSRVVDKHGQKMSKSKGNVVNPIEMVDKYGADALRMSLIFGAAPGSDIVIAEDKIRGMRNFANKLWNIGRFITMNFEQTKVDPKSLKIPISPKSPIDQQILKDLNLLITSVTRDIEKYRFSDASQALYDFTWHTLADKYIEESKDRLKNGDTEALAVIRHVFFNILKLLHPFMPFITEDLYQQLPHSDSWEGTPLIISSWPTKRN